MDPGTSDGQLETTLTIGAGMVAAGLAAVTAVPLVTVAAQATRRWTSTELSRALDSAAYGALLGLAVALALLIAQRRRGRPGETAGSRDPGSTTRRDRACGNPALALTAPPVFGAAVCAVSALASWWLRIEDASAQAVALHLAASVAFGAAIGGATRLHDQLNRGCAIVGGALGGFAVWLSINALHASLGRSADLAAWRELGTTPRIGTQLLGSGLAAALPAVAVPLGVTAADALARIWRR